MDSVGQMNSKERALPGECVAAVDRVLTHLSEPNRGAAVRIAELPGGVRGYEALKLRRMRACRDRLARELAHYEAEAEAASRSGTGCSEELG